MDEQISASSLIENLNDFSNKPNQSLSIDDEHSIKEKINTNNNNTHSVDFINLNGNANDHSNLKDIQNLDSTTESNQINDLNFLTNTNKNQSPSQNEKQFENKNEESDRVQANETQMANNAETSIDTNNTQLLTQETNNTTNIETNVTGNNIEMNNVDVIKEETNGQEKASANHVMSNLENSIMTVSNEQNGDDAVAAVIAAVEQSVAAKSASGAEVNGKVPATTASKPVKKKARTSSPNKNANQSSTVNSHLNNGSLNNSINDLTNNTSPSSTQKRRKKDPHAPKAPLNGYLVYFNEERAEMRSKNPQMSFGELTKIIASKWKDLPVDEKQRYINEADVDKERYNKEMVDYKNSNAYKQYLKENSLAKLNKNGEIETNSHIHEQTSNMTNGDGPNLNWLQQENNIAGFDVPIFTEEFIEYSKSREQEMRQLRKEIAEMEKQNTVLHNHIDNLKQSTTKIESDIERFKSSNSQMQKNADLFRQTILHCFNNIALPNTQEYPTPNNIDDYIMKTYAILNATMQTENSNESAYSLNRQFANHVKSVFSKINFSSLFESV